MKTLKLFVLSILYGQSISFLTDLILLRIAKSLAGPAEARDLAYLMESYEPDWGRPQEDGWIDPDGSDSRLKRRGSGRSMR